MSPSQERDLQILLIRLDERTQHIKNDIDEMKEDIKNRFDDFKEDYVEKVEFAPVKKIVFGLVGVVMLGVVGVGLSMVIRTTPDQIINESVLSSPAISSPAKHR